MQVIFRACVVLVRPLRLNGLGGQLVVWSEAHEGQSMHHGTQATGRSHGDAALHVTVYLPSSPKGSDHRACPLCCGTGVATLRASRPGLVLCRVSLGIVSSRRAGSRVEGKGPSAREGQAGSRAALH